MSGSAGHTELTDWEAFRLDVPAAEAFVLRRKFMWGDPPHNEPGAGTGAPDDPWAEPRLLVAVSVTSRAEPDRMTTLLYALTRSRWQSALEPRSEDMARLWDAVVPRVRLAVESWAELGMQPPSMEWPEFV